MICDIMFACCSDMKCIIVPIVAMLIRLLIGFSEEESEGHFYKLLGWVWNPSWKPPIFSILTSLILINLFSLIILRKDIFKSNALYAYLSAITTVDLIYMSTSFVFAGFVTT